MRVRCSRLIFAFFFIFTEIFNDAATAPWLSGDAGITAVEDQPVVQVEEKLSFIWCQSDNALLYFFNRFAVPKTQIKPDHGRVANSIPRSVATVRDYTLD